MNFIIDISIVYLNTSILFTKAALPSSNVCFTHSILVLNEENGAENEASAPLNDIPISAYFNAAQSFAPSPVIHTLLL